MKKNRVTSLVQLIEGYSLCSTKLFTAGKRLEPKCEGAYEKPEIVSVLQLSTETLAK